MKLYYLTRSYNPYQKGGGPLMRNGAVKYLQKLGWDVTVVMPNYSANELNIEDNIIQIPQSYNIKLHLYLERLGLKEDYLDDWIEDAFEYLKNKISKNDILFTTSGGELGMIKLGSLLKDKIGCKFIVNFRDPLDYSLVHGKRQDSKFHVSREKQEKRYLSNSDLIITSSKTNQSSLEKKYPDFKNKIKNNYFGYIKKLNINNIEKKDNKLKIAYVGNMGTLQKPEILYDIYENLNKKENIEIYFIGDITSNKTLQNIKTLKNKNIIFIDFLPHDKFLEFMSKNIDVGFVSLTSDYLGACVPSKIYEYINLGLPMLGALPEGDGKDIINSNSYGIACKYDDIDRLVKSMEKFMSCDFLDKCKKNILKDRDSWSMENRIVEVDNMLKKIK